MVSPHRHRQRTDAHGGEDDALVAKDWLAREDRDDLARDAEEWQREDIDLRMAEEPEQVLPEDRAAVLRREHHRSVMSIDERDDEGSGKNREGNEDEQRGHEDGPGEHRHPEHGHARCAHAEDGGDEVHRAEDRAETTDREAEQPQVATHSGRVHGVAQRRVGEPAEGCSAPGGEDACRDRDAAEEEQPEPEHVETREGDVRGTDLQGHDHVRVADVERCRKEEQHDRAVHRKELVVLLERHELQAGHGEFGADCQGHCPGDEEPEGRKDEVHVPDHLVVGRGNPGDDHRSRALLAHNWRCGARRRRDSVAQDRHSVLSSGAWPASVVRPVSSVPTCPFALRSAT